MSKTFSALLLEIDAELSDYELGGAYAWMDRERDNAFTKAADRFENALVEAEKTKNYQYAKAEGEHYVATLLPLLKEYKRVKQLDDADCFLSGLPCS